MYVSSKSQENNLTFLSWVDIMKFGYLLLNDKNVQFTILTKFLVIFFCPEVLEFFLTRPEVNTPLTSLRHCKNTENDPSF